MSERPLDATTSGAGKGWWWKCLAIGTFLWLAAAAVTFATHDPILMPMLILLGSFLVPCTVTLLVMERATGALTVWRIAGSFAISGICGVLAAALIESRLVDDVWVYFRVGFVEELIKGAIIVCVGWTVRPKTARQGALLGAAVGAGFAAFESAGYAYSAALHSPGLGVIQVLQTEALRAALTPIGHVLWSATLGAVLFRGPSTSGYRPRWRAAASIAVCFLGVTVLHALWDSMAGVSLIIAMLMTGNGWHLNDYEVHFLHSLHRAEAASLANWIYPLGLALVAFIGVSVLRLVVSPPRLQRSDVG